MRRRFRTQRALKSITGVACVLIAASWILSTFCFVSWWNSKATHGFALTRWQFIVFWIPPEYQDSMAGFKPGWEFGGYGALGPMSMGRLGAFGWRPVRSFGPLSVVATPLWIPTVAFATATYLFWRSGGRRRYPAGRCQKCGYDLTGNVSGRCPECGEPT